MAARPHPAELTTQLGEDGVGGRAAEERNRECELLGRADDESAARCAAGGARDLVTNKFLAAHVLKESLKQTGDQGISKMLGAVQDLDEVTVFEPGHDEAVHGGVGEVDLQETPAMDSAVAFKVVNAGFEGLLTQHGLAEAGEFAIQRSGDSPAEGAAAGREHTGPHAGFLGLEDVLQRVREFMRHAEGTFAEKVVERRG
jgi:hypothetical protein